MRRSTLTPLVLWSLAWALGACTEVAEPTAPEPPSLVISDGAHAGNAHFYFLPPMVSDPSPTGVFDGSRSPVVQICEWDGGSCDVVVATFTTTDGPGSETVRLGDDHYIVNWHTDDFNLDPVKTYRIRVLVDGLELGFADVELGANRSELKNVNTNEYVPLLDGRTLPIKFRIETGQLCLFPPAGMVGWWPGDGSTADLINGNDGTFPYGGGYDVGKVGGAFSFDGYDDFMLVQDPADGALDFGTNQDFSIDAWVNLKTPTDHKTDDIVVKVIQEAPYSAGYSLRLHPTDHRAAFQLTPDGNTSHDLFSTGQIPLNTWTHIVAVRSGDQGTLYINGTVNATGPLTDVSLDNDALLSIGGIYDTRSTPRTQLNNNFGGLVDEVEIFNRALTPYEVANLFNAGPAGKCKP